MALLQEQSISDATVKFLILTKKLLSVTQERGCDKKLVNSYLNEINEVNYNTPIVFDSNATLLLTNQLCSVVQPSELHLVKNTSQLLVNLGRCGERFHGRTFIACKRWILECLEFADHTAYDDLLLALQSLLRTGPFDIINQDLRNLLGNGGLLLKFVAVTGEWTETQFLAISCLEAILASKESNGAKISSEFLQSIQNIVIDMVSSVSYESQNKQHYNKIIGSSLRILRCIVADKSLIKSADMIGKMLGIVQSFMLHGVKGCPHMKAHHLRPAAMNLPEASHSIPRGRNIRSQKLKSRRQPKKETSESPNNVLPQIKGCSNKYLSDSDTSDTEIVSPAHMESRVRLEALQLLNSIVQNTPSREIFGYWPQIVASGSRADARVLTRCILKEPMSKVRQIALAALTELLLGAKLFLMHAEDVERSSFITFFGTVSAMIREMHSTLSLLLSTEKNIAVLTHALKCSAALAQGTPYSRLKPGLATKLIRNCRLQVFHKDPTVRVAALSVCEALAMSDPITPEILDILLKQTKSDTDTELSQLNLNTPNDTGTENEFEFENIEDEESDTAYICDENTQDKEISSLLYACLRNVSNQAVSVPVRLASVKLIGALAFNARTVVFPHLEIVATALVSALSEPETPVALHAGRVIETIAGCIANSGSNVTDGQTFWNIVFNPVTKLAQNSQTTLREAACDCLGNIGSDMLSLLSRERSIMIITTLFGAVRDEESAVRAAALRALGMLVELPSLEDDVGFLMDLVDVVCSALGDKNPGVKVKAAWTLANLCDCLVRQEGNNDVEPIPLEDILPRLHQASVKASKDHDKVKCNAVRAVGSTLYLCPNKQILRDTSQGLDALVNCAISGNDMKVRWNSCRALGFVLSHHPDRILPLTWRDQVFPALCSLVCLSPNFKVRTNAAWALSVCQSYGRHILLLWKSIVSALENSQHVPSYVEYSHRDTLVQQLCLTLSHLAVHTLASDLPALWDEIKDHIDDTSVQMKQFQERVLPEKAGDTIKAKEQMIKYSQNAATSQERQIANALIKIFERSDCYDNLDISSTMNY
ncbi:HEAT repeat-containing protein 6 [Neodiprion fabricii]|uniref:HEAT repeat-containing protein 6 n=1 Tax=Neodiprion fabricii TaxID=2872261 RepID=UPI001ED95590|nr:HEAT repeat-containing protein 6 [Neodiprion fabricii]